MKRRKFIARVTSLLASLPLVNLLPIPKLAAEEPEKLIELPIVLSGNLHIPAGVTIKAVTVRGNWYGVAIRNGEAVNIKNVIFPQHEPGQFDD